MKTQIRKWLEEQSVKPALESAEGEGKPVENTDKPVEVEVEAPKDIQEDTPKVEEVIKAVSVEDAEEAPKTEDAPQPEEVKAEAVIDAPVVGEPKTEEEPKDDVVPAVDVPPTDGQSTIVEIAPVVAQEEEAAKLVTDEIVEEAPKVEEAPIEKPVDETVAVPADEHGEVPPAVVPVVDEAPKEEGASEEPKEEVKEESVSTEEAKSEEALILDGATTTIAEQQQEAENVAADIDELEESQVAMERYLEILKEAHDEGGLSQQAAAIMRVNLESYEKRFGLEKPMTPALEAFGGTMSQRAATVVSMEGIKDVIEMIKKAIAAAWQHLKEAVSALITRFAASVDAHSKKVEELKKAVAGIDSKAKGASIGLSNPALLFADGDFLGNEKGAIGLVGIVDFALKDYPQLLIKLQEELHGKVMASLEKEDESIADLGDAVFKKAIASFPAVDVIEQDAGYETRQHLPLFGNKNLVLKTPGATYTHNRTPMTLSIIDLKRGKPAPEKYDTEPTTKASLEARLKWFEGVIKTMDGFGDIAAKLKAASEKTIKEVETVQKKLADEFTKAPDSEKAAAAKKHNRLGGILDTANVLNAQYSGVVAYIEHVLRNQLALIAQEIKSFK